MSDIFSLAEEPVPSKPTEPAKPPAEPRVATKPEPQVQPTPPSESTFQPAGDRTSVSVVIPVYNESESLAELHQALSQAAAGQPYAFDFFYVDDGSTDDSWNAISQLVQSDPRVTGVKLRRNFGKATALHVGFRESTGQYVITIDADLQDDPSELPRLLKAMSSFDLVSGWKKDRQDPWHKTYPSKIFNRLLSVLSGVFLHDHNCGFKCYRRALVDQLELYGDWHRFTPVLADSMGFRIGELPVKHRARKYGRSKYGWTRFVTGMVDILVASFHARFRDRPHLIFGMIGVGSALIGAGYFLLSFLLGLLLGLLARIGLISSGSTPPGMSTMSGLLLAVFVIGVQALFLTLISAQIRAQTPAAPIRRYIAEIKRSASRTRETAVAKGDA